MKNNLPDAVTIIILFFLAGFLVATLFFRFILTPDSDEHKDNEIVSSQSSDKKQLSGKTQEFSIRGYKFKTTTVCLEEKEIMFVFHKGEP